MRIFTFLIPLLALFHAALGQQGTLTEVKERFVVETGTGIRSAKEITSLSPDFGIPETGPTHHVISHMGYSLLYSEPHEQARWVAYKLTKEKTRKTFERTNKFLVDPTISTGSATHTDFRKSGFDRGHLAPAADMAWAKKAMAESFYYSNISPQTPSFNRGIWKRMEALVRKWAMENESIYIVTGPVLTEGLDQIGINGVSIPHYFYKVILDYADPEIKGIAFIVPHIGSKDPLMKYAVSIDSAELFTGMNFFPSLSEEEEQKIETNPCLECWSW